MLVASSGGTAGSLFITKYETSRRCLQQPIALGHRQLDKCKDKVGLDPGGKHARCKFLISSAKAAI